MFADLKSQSATSSLDENTHGGRRKLPFAFTEQGIAILSSVLRSEVAVQANINPRYIPILAELLEHNAIMETFRQLYREKVGVVLK